MTPSVWPTNTEVETWLESSEVALAPDGPVVSGGEGTWSRCFAFCSGGRDLIVKLSPHRDDLFADAFAPQWSSSELPIPAVYGTGDAFGCGFVVMSRSHGAPLEASDAPAWQRLTPRLVELLESLRTADASSSDGWGGWDPVGNGQYSSWDAFIASVARPAERIGEWEHFLRAHTDVAKAYEVGVTELCDVTGPPVPRSLIHGDLLYRNVHVDGDAITGVFDWGCAMYGDHLFDLAWLEFWSTWYPAMDFAAIDAALRGHWSRIGHCVHNEAQRRRRCLLQIGVSHLIWNASRNDEHELLAVHQRLGSLGLLPQ